ncbi:hypothetical protein llg_00160 [Luteolibacter sp. LG18]|nr:hypothetical protein llg_00160 [Luteolibacter sp. LG18]
MTPAKAPAKPRASGTGGKGEVVDSPASAGGITASATAAIGLVKEADMKMERFSWTDGSTARQVDFMTRMKPG